MFLPRRTGQDAGLELATFAGGCFWGVEAVFRRTPGVVATRVGFAGGHSRDPTYEAVCRGETGHAEAVEVTYDPARVSYRALLKVFWQYHDPTTLNRQGPDIGHPYRSAIFYHTPDQRDAAFALKDRLDGLRAFPKPIVTEIVPASTFFPAEEYHQRYYEKNGGGSACHVRRPLPDLGD
jgi:peptide-methionine (S)-S-oxide reductase